MRPSIRLCNNVADMNSYENYFVNKVLFYEVCFLFGSYTGLLFKSQILIWP